MLLYVLLIIGFLLLVTGANFLVDSASSIARKLRVSDLAIGLTVVAFGTSTPELIVNVFASIRGTSDIVIGNILGSNIANVLLILGISAIIYPLAITKDTVWKEIPLSLLAAIILIILANDKLIDGDNFAALTKIDGLVLLIFFVIFMQYVFGAAKKKHNKTIEDPVVKVKQCGLVKSLLFVGLGLVALNLGGKWVIEGAVKLAESARVSQSLIGLTVVAVGTSLPELATSTVAAYRKNTDIAVGNIVGSNIFNIFFILGISSLIKPIPLINSSNVDMGMVIFASTLLFVCMFTGGKKHFLERWEGIVFVTLYAAYITFLIIRR